MKLGNLLIAVTGAFLLSTAACAGGAREAAAESTDKGTVKATDNATGKATVKAADNATGKATVKATGKAAAAAAAPNRTAAKKPYRVRWAEHILEKHFDADQFELHQSDHFVMLHDTDAARASVRVALLENTYARFYEAFGQFCELDEVTEPLICVLFANRDDFAHYARRVDWLDMSWSGGYYSSRTNRMALYDSKPLPPPARADADGSDKAEGESREAASGEARHAQEEQEIVLLSSMDEAGASATPRMNVASTTHEAAHQLAFNSGLQTRGVMYPLWVSEGLACAFETNAFGEPFGLGKINPSRLTDLRIALDKDRLVPMREFVSMTRPPVNDAARLYAVYAQAWALYRFLYLEQRDALGAYMHELSRMPQGRRSKDRLRREFVQAFGPMDEVEARWLAHVEGLRDKRE